MADVLEKLIQGSAPVVIFLCAALWLAFRGARWAVTKSTEALHGHVIPEYRESKAMMHESLQQRKADGVRVDHLITNSTRLAEAVAANSSAVAGNGKSLDEQKERLAEIVMKIDGVPERVVDLMKEHDVANRT